MNKIRAAILCALVCVFLGTRDTKAQIMQAVMTARPAASSPSIGNKTQGEDLGSSVASLASDSFSVSASSGIAVCTSGFASGLTTTVTDNDGDTYTQISDVTNSGNTSRHITAFINKSATANGSKVLTAHYSPNSNGTGLVGVEIKNLLSSQPFDNFSTGDTASASSVTAGKLSTNFANSVILACARIGSGTQVPSPDTGYTLDKASTTNAIAIEHQIFSSAQVAVQPAMSWSGTATNHNIIAMALDGASQNSLASPYFFSWNFESPYNSLTDPNTVKSVKSTDGNLTINTTSPISGSSDLQIVYSKTCGGACSDDHAANMFINSTADSWHLDNIQEFTMEFDVVFATPGAGDTVGAVGKVLYVNLPTSDSPSYVFELLTGGGNHRWQWFSQNSPGGSTGTACEKGLSNICFGSNDQDPYLDTVKHVKLHFKMNTTVCSGTAGDGVLEWWIDGSGTPDFQDTAMCFNPAGNGGTNIKSIAIGEQVNCTGACTVDSKRYFDNITIKQSAP